MAASRSTRVTRSTVGLNSLDENFCGRTLRNRSIAHPDDVIPQSLLRSRSPKKKNEPGPVQKGSGTKNIEVKQPAPRESWVSPRKRGLSLSEKDSIEKDSVDNSERKSTGPLSPVLKKIKCYLRSDEPNSPGDEPPTALLKEESERRNSASDNEIDTSRPKQAHRCLLLDDSNKREVKNDFVLDEQFEKSIDEEVFNHETVNGIDDGDTAASNCNDCQSDGAIKLKDTIPPGPSKDLIVSENGSVSSVLTNNIEDTLLDHHVPCSEESEIQDHKPVRNCLSDDPVTQTNDSTDLLSTVRDSEEEVDVVGDSGCKEHAAGVSGGILNPDQEHSISAGPDSELSLSEIDSVASHGACLSDTQEHKFTLRTSPRRHVSAKDSPSICDSPWGENGHVEESKISSNVNSGVAGTVNGSLINSEAIVHGDKTQVLNSVKCSPDEQTRPSAQTEHPPEVMPSTKESGSLHTAEEEDDDPDVYYFESDHVALKHNKDYQRLLQTISVLEAQRNQAVQDLERLGQHQQEALADPIGFVEALQKKMNIGIPLPQRIVQLPEIAWDQYTTTLGNFERELRNRKRLSRRIKLIYDKVGIPSSPQRTSENKDGESASYSTLPQSDRQECSTSHHSQIRGRLCAESKLGTFNQLWTIEEQKKLEQLLLKFPPEEVESKRWQKIADELGNRSAKQVASRVQKYFIKLTKAGIPVPGRTPNLYMYSKKSANKRQHSLNKHLFRPSTFMTSHEPPVYMDEDEDPNSFHNRGLDGAGEDEISDEEDIADECREFDEYKQLLELKKLKKQKLHEIQAESGFIQHMGFKCDNCETEPIQGIRWHCQDCPPNMAVDFCDSCSDCLFETELHKEDHELQPIYKAETFLDRDYCMPHGTSYNYLDPNYFPANR
ncbi:ZZ-type zinc finger-containing protein 3 [Pelobates fuscus]|uniref:ZZ-type zinc finger-containing protein 3 n=1 Tax=Pelobates fuscus TaxID=191477 RepID=UPI002FE48884